MMKRIYGLLLLLYPREIRTPFAPEMSAVFAQLAEDRRAQGWAVFTSFVVGEVIGLLRGAAAAHRDLRQPVLDLRRMRPPGVSREVYCAALDEIITAQRQADFTLSRMQQALARNDFVRARFYSDEDRRARENLRMVRRRYGITE